MLKKNGDFVVRISDDKTVLSVQWKEKPLHYVISKTEKGNYTIDGKWKFDSIADLIAYFVGSKDRLGRNAQLIRPIPRQPWQLAHDHINLIMKIGEGLTRRKSILMLPRKTCFRRIWGRIPSLLEVRNRKGDYLE